MTPGGRIRHSIRPAAILPVLCTPKTIHHSICSLARSPHSSNIKYECSILISKVASETPCQRIAGIGGITMLLFL
jgi:hypothetical protein